MSLLPAVETLEDYRPLYRQDAPWRPAVETICDRHGLDVGSLRRGDHGSHVVFRTDRRWIKLFAPLWRRSHQREHLGLVRAAELAVPSIVAEGEIEGWPYLVLTHVEGVRAGDVVAGLPDAEAEFLAAAMGEWMARLHALPTHGLDDITDDWPAFVARQRAGCIAHHRQGDATEPWLEQIAAWLETAPPPHEPESPPVLLHADLTDDHFLLRERAGCWEIAGVIDFGDAMVGHAPYEFAAPCVFFFQRRPAPRRAMLRAYGLEPTSELSAKITAYTMLHKYGRFAQYLRFLEGDPPRDFAEFAAGLAAP